MENKENKRKYSKPELICYASFTAKTQAVNPANNCDGFGGINILTMGDTGSFVEECTGSV